MSSSPTIPVENRSTGESFPAEQTFAPFPVSTLGILRVRLEFIHASIPSGSFGSFTRRAALKQLGLSVRTAVRGHSAYCLGGDLPPALSQGRLWYLKYDSPV